MEYTKWLLDTSLDLNAKPMRPPPLNTEVEGNSINELGRKMSEKEEVAALVEELNRMSEENKRLTEMSIVLCENYNTLRSQLMDYMSKNRKRKAAESSITNNNGTNGHSESSSSGEDSSCKKPREEHIKPKISRVYVRTEPSDTGLLVKDGYQWRKYGQKVTRDNPCPRAYFKCSFAPSCPVKKKVQRSVEDQSVLVANYEGEHNHPSPSRPVTTSASYSCTTSASVPYSTTLPSSGPNTITIDLTQPQPKLDAKSPTQTPRSPEFQQFLIEQMTSALTKDPSFKSAIAAAISGGFLQK